MELALIMFLCENYSVKQMSIEQVHLDKAMARIV